MPKLTIDIGVVTTKVRSGIKRVNKLFRTFGNRIKSVVTSGLGMLGLSAGISGVAFATKKLIDDLDNLGKTARNLDLRPEDLQKMEFAMRRSGGSAKDVTTGMRRMVRQVNDLKRGLSTAKDVFGELGLELDDLKGKKTHELFKLIATALTGVEDNVQKAAIAQEVFGRGGIKLIEMAANYENLADEAEKLGIIISDKNVKAAEKFNDEMENSGKIIRASLVESGFVKWLSDIAVGFSEIIKSGSIVKETILNILKAAEQGKGLINLVSPITLALKGIQKFRGGKSLFGEGPETGAITPEEELAETKKLEKKKTADAKRDEIKAKTAAAQEAKRAKQALQASSINRTTGDKLTNLQNIGGNLPAVTRINKSEMLMKTQVDIQKSMDATLNAINSKMKSTQQGRHLAR
jgi:hypothetical protein